jgi:hypothetical protein
MSDAEPPGAGDLRARVAAVLAAFHGKQVPITEAGKENMRTVNRLGRIVTMRVVATDKTFRHNISRYRMNELDEDMLIGARREGNGMWSLVAELVAREG